MKLTAFPAEFPATRWSLVLAASKRLNGEISAEAALEELCRQYWFPLYAFARRCGHPPAVAEDLTQGFFALLLSHALLAKADRDRGRLRSFLLGSFKNFISTEARRDQCAKRGGGQPVFSLDHLQAEQWFGVEPAEMVAPEVGFDRDWAHAMVAQAFTALELEWGQRGKAGQFGRLKEFLSCEGAEPNIAAAARDLGIRPGAVRVAIHRLRLGFRRQLEAQVANTVTNATELADELRHLHRILQG